MIRRSAGKLKIIMGLVLLSLILLRLIVVQLQQYPYAPGVKTQLTFSYIDLLYELKCSADLLPNSADSRFHSHEAASISQSVGDPWLISPALSYVGRSYCSLGTSASRSLTIIDQWLLVLSTILSIFAARFLSGSWMVSLVVGCVVIYRNSLADSIGAVSLDGYLQVLFTLWLASAAHFIKTGSLWSLGMMVGAVQVGALFDLSFSVLALCLPVMLIVGFPFRKAFAARIVKRLQRRRRRKRLAQPERHASMAGGKDTWASRLVVTTKWMLGQGVPENPSVRWGVGLSRGGVFRVIRAPFGLWVFRKNRWKHLIIGWVVAFALIVAFSAAVYGLIGLRISGAVPWPPMAVVVSHLKFDWFTQWCLGTIFTLDLYGALSLGVIIFCAVQSPTDGIFSFLEATWMVMIAIVGLLVFAFIFDMINYPQMSNLQVSEQILSGSLAVPFRKIFLWCEPALLMFGIAGCYNLIKVADTRFGDGR